MEQQAERFTFDCDFLLKLFQFTILLQNWEITYKPIVDPTFSGFIVESETGTEIFLIPTPQFLVLIHSLLSPQTPVTFPRPHPLTRPVNGHPV